VLSKFKLATGKTAKTFFSRGGAGTQGGQKTLFVKPFLGFAFPVFPVDSVRGWFFLEGQRLYFSRGARGTQGGQNILSLKNFCDFY